jgi:membrane-associated phospholipid phosphatase
MKSQSICVLTWIGPFVLLAAAGANVVRGEDADLNWGVTLRSDAAAFPAQLFDDSRATFINTDNAAILLGTGAASLLMHVEGLDRRVAEHFDRQETFGPSGNELLFNVGSPYAHLAVAGLWYGLSLAGQDDLNRERALTLLSVLAITDTVTLGLKAAVHNERPNGDKGAWPSAHTSSSFAVASVLHEYYGWQVGVPAYAVAGLVTWRMMDEGDHWASDVLFGAVLGCVVGHTVAAHHKGLDEAGLEIAPFFGDSSTRALGVSLVKRF